MSEPTRGNTPPKDPNKPLFPMLGPDPEAQPRRKRPQVLAGLFSRTKAPAEEPSSTAPDAHQADFTRLPDEANSHAPRQDAAREEARPQVLAEPAAREDSHAQVLETPNGAPHHDSHAQVLAEPVAREDSRPQVLAEPAAHEDSHPQVLVAHEDSRPQVLVEPVAREDSARQVLAEPALREDSHAQVLGTPNGAPHQDSHAQVLAAPATREDARPQVLAAPAAHEDSARQVLAEPVAREDSRPQVIVVREDSRSQVLAEPVAREDSHAQVLAEPALREESRTQVLETPNGAPHHDSRPQVLEAPEEPGDAARANGTAHLSGASFAQSPPDEPGEPPTQGAGSRPPRNPLSQGREILTGSLDSGFRFLKLAALLALVVILFSGVKFISPQEVAIIKRFGRIVGQTRAEQVHGPGLLFAFPYLIDEVVRVPVKQVQELPLSAFAATPVVMEVMPAPTASDRLASSPAAPAVVDAAMTAPGVTATPLASPTAAPTAMPAGSALDPELAGYCVTGDKNIVHTTVLVKYQISDPIDYALYSADPSAQIHDAVAAALTQTMATTSVDAALTGGKRAIATSALNRAQKKLDATRCGVQLAALEFREIRAPDSLKTDFDAVVSAYVGMQTAMQQARTYRASTVPAAQAARDTQISQAQAAYAARVAQANGDTSLFRNVIAQYRANPGVVKERLYREAMDAVMTKVGVQVLIPEGQATTRILLPSKAAPIATEAATPAPTTTPAPGTTPAATAAPGGSPAPGAAR